MEDKINTQFLKQLLCDNYVTTLEQKNINFDEYDALCLPIPIEDFKESVVEPQTLNELSDTSGTYASISFLICALNCKIKQSNENTEQNNTTEDWLITALTNENPEEQEHATSKDNKKTKQLEYLAFLEKVYDDSHENIDDCSLKGFRFWIMVEKTNTFPYFIKEGIYEHFSNKSKENLKDKSKSKSKDQIPIPDTQVKFYKEPIVSFYSNVLRPKQLYSKNTPLFMNDNVLIKETLDPTGTNNPANPYVWMSFSSITNRKNVYPSQNNESNYFNMTANAFEKFPHADQVLCIDTRIIKSNSLFKVPLYIQAVRFIREIQMEIDDVKKTISNRQQNYADNNEDLFRDDDDDEINKKKDSLNTTFIKAIEELCDIMNKTKIESDVNNSSDLNQFRDYDDFINLKIDTEQSWRELYASIELIKGDFANDEDYELHKRREVLKHRIKIANSALNVFFNSDRVSTSVKGSRSHLKSNPTEKTFYMFSMDTDKTPFGNMLYHLLKIFVLKDLFRNFTEGIKIFLETLSSFSPPGYIRPHPLQTGKYSTGKSFLLNMFKCFYPDGCIREEIHISTLGLFAQEFQRVIVDGLLFMHEGDVMNGSGSPQERKSGKASIFKTLLTEYIHTISIFNIKKNGAEDLSKLVSLTVCTATNSKIEDENIGDRRSATLIKKPPNSDEEDPIRHTSNDMQSKLEKKPHVDKTMKWITSVHLLIEKLIFTLAIPDINTDLMKVVLTKVINHVKASNGITVTERRRNMIINVSRSIVIFSIATQFLSEVGIEEFHISYNRNWEKLINFVLGRLYVTWEIAIFTISMYKDMLTGGEVQFDLLNVLNKASKHNTSNVVFKECHEQTPQGRVTEIDYRYYKITYNGDVYEYLLTLVESKYTLSDIKEALTILTKKYIPSHHYKKREYILQTPCDLRPCTKIDYNPTIHTSDWIKQMNLTATNMTTEKIVSLIIDESRSVEKIPIMQIPFHHYANDEEKCIYIAVAQLQTSNDVDALFTEALKSLQSKATPEGDYLLCHPYSIYGHGEGGKAVTSAPSYLDILNVITIRESNKPLLLNYTLPDKIMITPTGQKFVGDYVMKDNLELYIRHQYLSDNSILVEGLHPFFVSSETLYKKCLEIRSKDKNYDEPITYPDDIIMSRREAFNARYEQRNVTHDTPELCIEYLRSVQLNEKYSKNIEAHNAISKELEGKALIKPRTQLGFSLLKVQNVPLKKHNYLNHALNFKDYSNMFNKTHEENTLKKNNKNKSKDNINKVDITEEDTLFNTRISNKDEEEEEPLIKKRKYLESNINTDYDDLDSFFETL